METSSGQSLKSCKNLSIALKREIPEAMEEWQIYGFFCGALSSGLILLSVDDEEAALLAADLLDELVRANEEAEVSGYEEGPPQEAVKKYFRSILETYETVASELEANDGSPDLPFMELAANQAKPSNLSSTEMLSAKSYARGLLRGIVMGEIDEEELGNDEWGEPLGLLFILTEDDPDPEFGTLEEISQARLAVAAGLTGITAKLYQLAHE